MNTFSKVTIFGGLFLLAALAIAPKLAARQAAVSAYSDNDILNFALNLEYL